MSEKLIISDNGSQRDITLDAEEVRSPRKYAAPLVAERFSELAASIASLQTSVSSQSASIAVNTADIATLTTRAPAKMAVLKISSSLDAIEATLSSYGFTGTLGITKNDTGNFTITNTVSEFTDDKTLVMAIVTTDATSSRYATLINTAGTEIQIGVWREEVTPVDAACTLKIEVFN